MNRHLLTHSVNPTQEFERVPSHRSSISVVHYWGGCPPAITSRFLWHLEILRACVERGWMGSIIFSEKPKSQEMRSLLADAGIRSIEIPRPGRQFDASCIRDAFRAYRATDCTIAHLHCVHTSPMIAAALAGVPVRIWSSHSSSYGDDGSRPQGLKGLAVSTRLTCRLAHSILPVSENTRDELGALGVPSDKMCLAPVPVDMDSYRAVDPDGVRAEFGFHDDDLVVVSVGKAIYRKGWDVLLEAVARVHQRGQAVKLLLVGGTHEDGRPLPFLGALESQIAELNLNDCVRFSGARQDIPRILAAADLFAFPSRAEGLPGALIEAMAAGLPCVATAADGAKEVISNGENGFLTAIDDSGELAERIIDLASSQPLRARIGSAGAESLERFTLGFQTNRVLKLYDKFLATGGR